jgi:hypothetical protein
MNATVAIKGLTYGYYPEMADSTQLVAIILNYGLIITFKRRFGLDRLLTTALMVIVVATIATYYVDPCAVGMSCVWCFQYGYARRRQLVDHTLFWGSCLGLFVPFFMQMWPWPIRYLWLCNIAHVIAAALGHFYKLMVLEYIRRPWRHTRVSLMEKRNCIFPPTTKVIGVTWSETSYTAEDPCSNLASREPKRADDDI